MYCTFFQAEEALYLKPFFPLALFKPEKLYDITNHY